LLRSLCTRINLRLQSCVIKKGSRFHSTFANDVLFKVRNTFLTFYYFILAFYSTCVTLHRTYATDEVRFVMSITVSGYSSGRLRYCSRVTSSNHVESIRRFGYHLTPLVDLYTRHNKQWCRDREVKDTCPSPDFKLCENCQTICLLSDNFCPKMQNLTLKPPF